MSASEFAAELTPTELRYDNDEGDPIRYARDIAYGNLHLVLELLDALDGVEEPASVSIVVNEGNEE